MMKSRKLVMAACAASVGLYGASLVTEARAAEPSAVPGLALWLDAADSSTVTAAAGKLQVWKNKATGEKVFGDAAQAVAKNQPTYGKDKLNGKSVVTLGPGQANGLPHWLDGDMPLGTSTGDVTLFAVHMRTDPNNKSWEQVIYLGSDRHGRTQGVPHLGKRSVTTQWGMHDAWRADKGAFIDQKADAIGKWWITSLCRSKSGKDGNGATLDVSGFGPAQLKASAKQAWPSGDSKGYSVGRQGVTGSVFGVGGQIAEILVYNRALTAAEQAQVVDYLGTKWGISVK